MFPSKTAPGGPTSTPVALLHATAIGLAGGAGRARGAPRPRPPTGCLAGLGDLLSRCIHPARRTDAPQAAMRAAVASSFQAPPAARMPDVSTFQPPMVIRVAPPDEGLYASHRCRAEALLKAFTDAPAFGLWQEYGDYQYTLHLSGPGRPARSLKSNEREWQGHVVRVDGDLNGTAIPRFDGGRILRNHLCETLLGRLGRGPVSALLILPSCTVGRSYDGVAVAPRQRPVVLGIRRLVQGRALEVKTSFDDARQQARSPDGAPALLAAYLFGIPGVYKPWGEYRNVVRTSDAGDLIVGGFDGSADRVTPDLLPDFSVGRLLGVSRAALLRMVDEAEAGTLAFARQNAEALAFTDLSMTDDRRARPPVTTLREYAAECRRRIGLMRD